MLFCAVAARKTRNLRQEVNLFLVQISAKQRDLGCVILPLTVGARSRNPARADDFCYNPEVSPIRKFVSNCRKFRPFRPLERSKLYSFGRFNSRNFRLFETNFLIGETSETFLNTMNTNYSVVQYSYMPGLR